jgi:hypothetical protein
MNKYIKKGGNKSLGSVIVIGPKGEGENYG